MKNITYLIAFLLTFNWGFGQTCNIFDDFNRADNASVGGHWTDGSNSSINSNELVITTGGSQGRDYIYQDASTSYSTQLDLLTRTITWSFNMQQSRPNPSGFNTNYYGIAFVVGGTNPDFTLGNGYAVVLGQTGETDNVRLVRYSEGIDRDSNLEDLVVSSSDFGTEHLSIKVTFNPSTDTWELFVRNDGMSFSDPMTLDGTSSQGSVVDTTYTNVNLGFLGAFWNHSSTSSEEAVFDNIFAGIKTTWDGSSWDNGTPDLTTEAVLNGSYDTDTNGSFSACSLTVNSGATLTVANNTYVEVENDVVVDGDLIVETQGNFVQNDDNGSFILNPGGVARVNKQTPVKAEWYYYTYWSSPVVGETIENVFPDVPTGRRFYFDAANYLDADDDGIEDNGGAWAIASGTMIRGVGYAATEGTLFPGGAAGTASFEGEFNNGIIEVDVYNNPANTGGSWNLIGNPYPSAIDFIAFQQANSSVIDGTAYFWSQASPPEAGNVGNEVLNFNTADYAIFTVGAGGGVKGGGSDTPDGYVASGQSFFVAGLTNDKATFTNAMRMADETSNNLFFKRNTSKKSTAVNDNKFWINLTSDNGVFKEILVVYVDGATNANDGMYYDAPKMAVSEAASLFSKIEGSNQAFAIQCKAASSLNEEETIALGFKTNIDVPTLYTLSLAKIQGDFLSGSPVYLKDNLLNKVHDLSVSDYTFTSEVGEFNERFVIGFSNSTLSTDTALTEAGSLKIVALDNDYVQFSTSNDLQIKSVAIYDLLGRALYNFKGSNSSETYKLSNLKSSVFLAKVELSNGAIISKKAVKK